MYVCLLQVQGCTTANRRSEETVPKIFQNQQNPNTFVLELKKKTTHGSHASHHARFCSLKKVSSSIIYKHAKHSKNGDCIQCIGHGTVCRALSSGSTRLRVAPSLGSGSSSCDVTTGSRVKLPLNKNSSTPRAKRMRSKFYSVSACYRTFKSSKKSSRVGSNTKRRQLPMFLFKRKTFIWVCLPQKPLEQTRTINRPYFPRLRKYRRLFSELHFDRGATEVNMARKMKSASLGLAGCQE